jgi:hypothetical protein
MNRLNPEKNAVMRAFLYVMGFWGYVHFTSALVQSLHTKDITPINSLRLTNLQKPIENIVDTPFVFIFGWLVFFGMVYLVYKWISRGK